MLNQEKTDEQYTKQFTEGDALTRGIMKFCPRCIDGECFSKKALDYSEKQNINRFSGHCHVMNGRDCPDNMLFDVFEDMTIYQQKYGNEYINPCFEDRQTVHVNIDVDEAQYLYDRMLRGEDTRTCRRCDCGAPLTKRMRYCVICTAKRKKSSDRVYNKKR